MRLSVMEYGISRSGDNHRRVGFALRNAAEKLEIARDET